MIDVDRGMKSNAVTDLAVGDKTIPAAHPSSLKKGGGVDIIAREWPITICLAKARPPS